MINVTGRLWINFDDKCYYSDTCNLIRKDPDHWNFCGTPVNEYIKRAEWIDENIIGDVDIKMVANLNDVFIFDNKEDAMAFKLRWI